MNIIEKCNTVNNENNKINKIFSLLELSNIDTNSISESVLITKTIMDNIDKLKDETGDIFDRMNDIPYYSPEEVDAFKDFYSKSVLRYLDEENSINSKTWIDSCSMIYNGIIPDNHQEYTRLWVNTLNRLFSELSKTEDAEAINDIKQNILDIGWNPECDFTIENRVKVTERKRAILKQKFNKSIYDVTNFIKNDDSVLEESKQLDLDRYPVYIVLTYTGSGFGKLINAYTHGIYSHAAISLDSDMSKLYSFNLKGNGFSIESISGYLKENKDSTMVVYSIFVNKKDILKIKAKLDYFLLNKKNTKYSIINILGLMINKPIEIANNMICSQFVDYILKTIDIDITKKHSGLVTPNDLYINLNPNIYKIFEGRISDYNYKEVEKVKDLFLKKGKKVVNESMLNNLTESALITAICENKNSLNSLIELCKSEIVLSENITILYENLKPYVDCLYEAKEFPIQFDKEGNLLIKRMKNIDFDHEFSQSHKLLKLYEDSENVDGMKYELSKLWFLNNLLEKKIYSETDEKIKNKYHKSRARILNDFNKYSKIVNNKEKGFNFTDYYNNSPFSDATIKINKSTLHHGTELMKNISKLLLH